MNDEQTIFPVGSHRLNGSILFRLLFPLSPFLREAFEVTVQSRTRSYS